MAVIACVYAGKLQLYKDSTVILWSWLSCGPTEGWGVEWACEERGSCVPHLSSQHHFYTLHKDCGTTDKWWKPSQSYRCLKP